ncbi:MAG: flagellar biosynthetic protein FliO [Myxococcota bacterium]
MRLAVFLCIGWALVQGVFLLPAHADTQRSETPDVASFPSPTTGPLARLAAAALAVGALGWGITVWGRRRTKSAPGTERIEIVARRSLGPRHHVVIVEAAGRRLLLGFSGDQIATLADLSDLPGFHEALEQSLPEHDRVRADADVGIGGLGALDG